MRKLALSAALAALLATSGGAQASTYSIGDLTALGDSGYANGISFSAGAVSDIFNFSLSGGTNDFGAAFTKLSLKPNQMISGFSALLTGPGSFSQNLSYAPASFGSLVVQTLGYNGPLSSGSYSLTISGSAATAGSYAVELLAAAPVPEPESAVLLLAGLGLISTVMRRRSSQAESV